jgi:hypothetical protein
MIHLLRIVRQSRHREKGDTMICVVIGRPCRDLIPELHVGANNEQVPRDHFVEAAGFYRDVMQLGLDHRLFAPVSGVSSALIGLVS